MGVYRNRYLPSSEQSYLELTRNLFVRNNHTETLRSLLCSTLKVVFLCPRLEGHEHMTQVPDLFIVLSPPFICSGDCLIYWEFSLHDEQVHYIYHVCTYLCRNKMLPSLHHSDLASSFCMHCDIHISTTLGILGIFRFFFFSLFLHVCSLSVFCIHSSLFKFNRDVGRSFVLKYTLRMLYLYVCQKYMKVARQLLEI